MSISNRSISEKSILYEDDLVIVLLKEAGMAVESSRPSQVDMVSALRSLFSRREALKWQGREKAREENQEKSQEKAQGKNQEKAQEKRRDGRNDRDAGNVRDPGNARNARDARDARDGLDGRNGVYLVHRLDQGVSGLIVFAKTRGAAADLSRQFSGGGVEKYYTALVAPAPDIKPPPECGRAERLVDYMVFDRRGNISRTALPEEKGARRAELEFRLSGYGGKSVGGRRIYLCDIRLCSGRHHQIRLQLSERGYPILGDGKYGFTGKEWEGGLCLSASHLSFYHPGDGRKMEFDNQPEFLQKGVMQNG